MLNVHPSLLPRWRGAAPIERAIDAGDADDRRLHHAPGRGDGRRPGLPVRGGRRRARRRLRVAVAPAGRPGRRAAREGARRSAPTAASSPPRASPRRRRSAPRTGALDPSRAALDLARRRVRALNPHVGTWIELPGGDRLGVRKRDRRRIDGDAPPQGALAAAGRAPAVRHGRRGARAARGPARRRPPDGGRRVATRARRPDRRLTAGARAVAYRVVRRVTADDAWADRAFRAEAERAALDPRERAFAQQLAYGTVQRLRTLDHALAAASSRPLDAGRCARCCDALRLGAYQVLYLDGVPDHAAVEQTVELVKAESAARARLRQRGDAARRPRGPRSGRRDRRLDARGRRARHSHPDWVARMWWDQLGPDARARADGARQRAARERDPGERAASPRATSWPRADRRRHRTPRPACPEGLVLDAPWDAHGSPLFAAGALIPQSRGSMTVARVLDPQPGDRVLDMCAAPGAKTTHVAALMRGEGRDRRDGAERRSAPTPLRANVRADAGAATSRSITGDAREAPAGPFDRILLDPPCSDLGTLQSRPDVRWRKSPDQVDAAGGAPARADRRRARAPGAGRHAGLLELHDLADARTSSRSSGCSADRPDVERDDLVRGPPGGGTSVVPGYLQLLPHRDGADGFFIARLRRRG